MSGFCCCVCLFVCLPLFAFQDEDDEDELEDEEEEEDVALEALVKSSDARGFGQESLCEEEGAEQVLG